MNHQNIAIRFILAGSCHPFTGRQVMFVVPADPNLTLAQVIKDHVQPNWPTKDLPDQQQKLQIEHLRVLKMGKVLTMEAPLLDAFSAEEKKQALEVGRRSDVGAADQALIAGGENDQQNESSNRISGAVLMHLFFRPMTLQGDAKTTSPSSASPEKPKSEKTAAESSEGCGCIIA